jgi:acetylornithine deacetylase/succinyl-diaminopimelate desuccinylase-like protein
MTGNIRNEVLEQINEDELVQTTRDLIRIHSVSGNEKMKAEYVEKKMKDLGLEVTVQEVLYNRPNVIGVLRGTGGGRNLVYTAHLDTHCPIGLEKPWCADMKGRKIYGLGTGDSHTGIAAFLSMIAALKRAKVKLKGNIMLVMDSDEFTRSRGLARAGDWMQDNRMLTPKDIVIMGEPSIGDIYVAYTGIVEFEVETLGGGFLRGGINAIEKMLKVISALQKMAREHEVFKKEHPLIGKPLFYIHSIEGDIKYIAPGSIRGQPETEVLPLGVRSWETFNLPGPGATCCYTPEFCKVRFGIRTLPGIRKGKERWTLGPMDGLSTKELFSLIDRTIKKEKEQDPEILYKLSIIQDRNLPVEISPDEPVVKILKKTVKEVTGKEPKATGVKWWVEGTILMDKLGVPLACYGPTDWTRVMSPEEYVTIDDLVTATKVYSLSALDVCEIA